MDNVKNVIVVLSGKGGVGKSTVAVNTAVSLAMQGKTTAILDVDIHGPSIVKMLKLEGKRVDFVGDKMIPVKVLSNLYGLSPAMMLENEESALIWRGPKKLAFIKQMIEDTEWGDLDYLVVDCPPGTGDEPLTVFQTIKECNALIVTTPQNVALIDVKKSIEFCRQMNVPVIGIVENMAKFRCPDCNKDHYIFKENGLRDYAKSKDIEIVASLPIQAEIANLSDEGKPFAYFGSEDLKNEFEKVTIKILSTDKNNNKEKVMSNAKLEKIAVPVVNDVLCLHFGHCEKFLVAEVDRNSKKIVNTEFQTPPPHEPGVIPKWLNELGVSAIISGGMGQRAQDLFTQFGISVLTGAPVEAPEKVIEDYLNDKLTLGANTCDH
ncbi:MAG: iron-sulfur cluster carrier protein MrpORP [Candidatus Muiribacteriota bacterium]